MAIRAIYISLITLLCIACGANNKSKRGENWSSAEMAAVNVQQVEINEKSIEQGISDTLQFGRMHSGEVIAKTLRIKNNTSHPLVLLRHTTTCGCIKVEYDRRPIAVNSWGEIRFEFDTHTLQGWQLKLMAFYFAEKGKPLKVYAEAEVE